MLRGRPHFFKLLLFLLFLSYGIQVIISARFRLREAQFNDRPHRVVKLLNDNFLDSFQCSIRSRQ